MIQLSVIVPTRDKWPRLRLTLAALENSAGLNCWEVIVVDDRSHDGTVDGLAGYDAPFSLHIASCPAPGGRSLARNTGAGLSTGDRLLFLDDDCLPAPGTLGAHAALPSEVIGHGRIYTIPYVKFYLDPASGAPFPGVQGHVPHAGLRRNLITIDLIRAGFQRIVEQYHKVNALERLAIAVLASPAHRGLRWVASAGANLSISRRRWTEIGGFDTAFGNTWGAEDLDFGLRATALGLSFVDVAHATVYHMDHVRATFAAQLRESFVLLHDRYPDRVDIPVVAGYLLKEYALEEVLQRCADA
jgi:glycosyltransferase involved in cell wall biosynthesis